MLAEYQQLVDEIRDLTGAAGPALMEENAPVLAAPLSADAVGVLRGVGGLTVSPRASAGKLAEQFTTPLPETAEAANGLWVRQITLDNPR